MRRSDYAGNKRGREDPYCGNEVVDAKKG